MRRLFTTLLVAGLALGFSGCSSDSNATPEPSTSASNQTIDPSLIPTDPPTDAIEVDAALFESSFGDYTFKVGDGPTWCSINVDNHIALCEQNEPDTNYKPVEAPASCELSYGYQLRLTATTPTDGTDEAGFMCSGSAYADAANAYTLNDGEVIRLDAFTCFVSGTTARCDNEEGKYIVLGPDAWAFGSKP